MNKKIENKVWQTLVEAMKKAKEGDEIVFRIDDSYWVLRKENVFKEAEKSTRTQDRSNSFVYTVCSDCSYRF